MGDFYFFLNSILCSNTVAAFGCSSSQPRFSQRPSPYRAARAPAPELLPAMELVNLQLAQPQPSSRRTECAPVQARTRAPPLCCALDFSPRARVFRHGRRQAPGNSSPVRSSGSRSARSSHGGAPSLPGSCARVAIGLRAGRSSSPAKASPARGTLLGSLSPRRAEFFTVAPASHGHGLQLARLPAQSCSSARSPWRSKPSRPAQPISLRARSCFSLATVIFTASARQTCNSIYATLPYRCRARRASFFSARSHRTPNSGY